ncbi:uncharacterized protein LOC132179938 isoform X1 [Corylus avellana]|uniref:uncharacterized protein LOC132179938 isoform X1 n=1 Tax=Corylus avellana TaxID=13451 RepID=UPI00286B53E3|nr:uncharacterized protein LOC132179938 isoform X1 [Corylus avellana]
MNSGNTSIRALGQRSIASSFLSCSSKSSSDSKEDIQSEASKKGSGASLADFLDRKLHTTSVLPRTVEGKSRPFSSPLGPIEASSTIDGFSEGKKVGEAKPNFVIGKVFFEQFKHTGEEKGDCEGSCSVGGEVESYKIDDVQESRKRRNPFQVGEDEKQTARKHLLVLGGDPKPKPKGREERFISKKKRRPLYNHYANGCGWWDCDMEGVDNEEVGVNEVWEGVGSTTLGGIEWH